MEEKKTALVTGCLGNLGVPVCNRLLDTGYRVIGIDNNTREDTLGADVSSNRSEIIGDDFAYCNEDIRAIILNREINNAETQGWARPSIILHTAAQVSHPYSIENPTIDFEINAWGTYRLLEFCRQYLDNAQFIHIGTAKIYGQNVDKLWPYEEQASRYWYKDLNVPSEHGHMSGAYTQSADGSTKPYSFPGVDEHCSFDQTMKTPFGCSKACADLYVQEYGRLYGLTTAVLRPGVFTGKYAKPSIYQNWLYHKFQECLDARPDPNNRKYALNGKTRQINYIGWRGKQVRDILHCDDLVNAIMLMIENPPPKGEVYNIGGGMDNAISVCEAVGRMFRHLWTDHSDYPVQVNTPEREGDWCVYVTDNSKLMKQYPEWKVTRDLDYIFQELYDAFLKPVASQSQVN